VGSFILKARTTSSRHVADVLDMKNGVVQDPGDSAEEARGRMPADRYLEEEIHVS